MYFVMVGHKILFRTKRPQKTVKCLKIFIDIMQYYKYHNSIEEIKHIASEQESDYRQGNIQPSCCRRSLKFLCCRRHFTQGGSFPPP